MVKINNLIKEQNSSEVALTIEAKTDLSLVIADEHKTEKAEGNIYYFFGGKDNNLLEIEVTTKKGKWLLKTREFKSKLPFKKYLTLEFN